MENHYVGTIEEPNSFDEGMELVERMIRAFDPTVERTLKQFHNDPDVTYIYNYYLKGIISNWNICRKWLKNPVFPPNYEENFITISTSNNYLRKRRIEELFSEDQKQIQLDKLSVLTDRNKLKQFLNSEIIYNLHLELDKICPIGEHGYTYVRSIDNGWNFYSKKLLLKQKRKEYKEYVNKHFEQFKKDYKRGVLNTNLVFKIGSYIASIQCGISDPENNLYNEQYMTILSPVLWNSMYPLFNDTGIFAINTYLYGFFNRIFLIGIPSQITLADSSYMCPGDLLDHDIGHMHNFENNNTLQAIDKNVNIYYEIINRNYYPSDERKRITQKNKEVMLLMLWWVIHEGNDIQFSYFKREATFEAFYRKYYFDSFLNLEVNWLEYYDVMVEIVKSYRQKSESSFSNQFNISSKVFETYDTMQENVGDVLNLACSKMSLWYLLYNIYYFDSEF